MRMFGTAVNHEFGEVEETGILIAVDEILEEKRESAHQTFSKESSGCTELPDKGESNIYTESRYTAGEDCCRWFSGKGQTQNVGPFTRM